MQDQALLRLRHSLKMKNSSLNDRLKSIIRIAVMTALISALSPLSIPIGVVPISLSTFIIMISAFVLNPYESLISVLMYIVLGAMGLPIFSSFTGGLSKLASPTGGYIFGYLFIPLPFFFIKDRENVLLNIIALLIGNILLYILGTLWLKFFLDIPIGKALMVGVIPFIITDLLKVVAVLAVGPVIYKTINHNYNLIKLKKGN